MGGEFKYLEILIRRAFGGAVYGMYTIHQYFQGSDRAVRYAPMERIPAKCVLCME